MSGGLLQSVNSLQRFDRNAWLAYLGFRLRDSAVLLEAIRKRGMTGTGRLLMRAPRTMTDVRR